MDLGNLKKIKFRLRNMIAYFKTSINYLHEVDLYYRKEEGIREKVSEFVSLFVKGYPYSFVNYCSQCGNCCKREDIFVRGGELFELGNCFEMSEKEFS